VHSTATDGRSDISLLSTRIHFHELRAVELSQRNLLVMPPRQHRLSQQCSGPQTTAVAATDPPPLTHTTHAPVPA